MCVQLALSYSVIMWAERLLSLYLLCQIQLYLSFRDLLILYIFPCKLQNMLNTFLPNGFTWLNFLFQLLQKLLLRHWVQNLLCADDTIIALIFLSLMKSALPRTDGTLLTLISQLSLHEQLIKHNLLCICLSAPEAQKAF